MKPSFVRYSSAESFSTAGVPHRVSISCRDVPSSGKSRATIKRTCGGGVCTFAPSSRAAGQDLTATLLKASRLRANHVELIQAGDKRGLARHVLRSVLQCDHGIKHAKHAQYGR